ncbi:hypothetical protein AB7C87_00300 [Natrarchaeobius sp. A-rgal3]|uniref:hypothetical protein n=1 Tax=Natrarchaeobius versutus TaxID=1679078 RepID=UPI00350FF0C5
MHDVIPTTLRSDRLLLAVSFACFAVAGGTNVAADAFVPTAGATVLAIVGVYCVAQYANRVSRRTLASLSLAFWIGFLVIAGVHAVGIAAIAGAIAAPAATFSLSLWAITWATLFVACSATTFLGFREYGSPAGAEVAEEQIIEGETSDYSTR